MKPTAANALRVTTLAIGALVMVTPFLYLVSTSFKAQQYVLKVPPQFIPDPATLSNYERVLIKGNFGHFFLNSLLVAGSSTIGVSTGANTTISCGLPSSRTVKSAAVKWRRGRLSPSSTETST